MKTQLITILLLLGAMVSAQKIDEIPYIESRGVAEREVVPDEIYLKVNIVAEKADEFEALNKKTLKALKESGVASEDITLADADGVAITGWFKKDGFETSKTLLVMTNSAEMIEKVMGKLHNIGVKEVGIARVEYSKKDELEDELRVEAVKNSKKKAQLMVTAIDKQLGDPLIIRENRWGASQVPQYESRGLMMANNSFASAKVSVAPITFKKMKFESEVSVRFAIE
jgi:uncharacterized protein YggE